MFVIAVCVLLSRLTLERDANRWERAKKVIYYDNF